MYSNKYYNSDLLYHNVSLQFIMTLCLHLHSSSGCMMHDINHIILSHLTLAAMSMLNSASNFLA